MAQATEPVFFCDPHDADRKRIIGDHYTIHIDGPNGPETWTVDLCSSMEHGKQGHDGPVQQLRSFLSNVGKRISGAELILPEDRKVIPHPKEEVPAVEPPKEEKTQRVPTASVAGLFFDGLEPPRGDNKPEGKPPVPDPGFSAGPPSEPIAGEREEEYPETLYDLIVEYTNDKRISVAKFATRLGFHSQTVYNIRRKPTNPQRTGEILKVMGYSGDMLQRLILKYADIPEAEPVNPTPGLEAVIDRTISRTPPKPKAVEAGDRSGGLHATAIYGNGQTRGSNPVLGIA